DKDVRAPSPHSVLTPSPKDPLVEGVDLTCGELAIHFASIADFQPELPFGMRVVQMSHGLRHSQKAMDIVCAGEQCARNFPGTGAVSGDQLDDFCLSLANRAQVPI